MSEDRLTALREAQARVSAVVLGAVPEGHHCGPISVTAEQWNELAAAHDAEDAARAALMPTEQDAIRLMHDAYTRLKALGWNDAIYCPKDGSLFDAIQTGSTGIFKTHYSGEWPDGHWWCEDGGDIWPARPTLYRVTEAELARREQMRAKFRALRDDVALSQGESPSARAVVEQRSEGDGRD